jgi:hypothetical protein
VESNEKLCSSGSLSHLPTTSSDPLKGGFNMILPPQIGQVARSFPTVSLWFASPPIAQLPKRRTKPPFCKLREIAQAGIANPPRMKQGQTRGVRVIPDTPKKPRMPRTLASNPKNAPHPVQKVLTARQMALRGQKMDKENFEDLVGKKSSKRRRGSPRRGISKRDSRRSTRRSSAR